jgi:anti-sigma regulatory factor (Ser/Thr protein kinase)
MYDKYRRSSGIIPSTVDLHRWSDAAFLTLYELGFFESVGHVAGTEQRYTDSPSGDLRTMLMITGTNSQELQRACEAILKLSSFIEDEEPLRTDVHLALNSALGEAMSNVAAHAYPESSEESEPASLRLWWISASADRRRRMLSVVIYDQGASIPATLPYRSWARTLNPARAIGTVAGGSEVPHPHDGDYIEFAMGEGNTQTGKPERGRGLPQMRELVKICGDGSLTILSRGGLCCYRPSKNLSSRPLPVPIDGTLIEWEMHLPRAA